MCQRSFIHVFLGVLQVTQLTALQDFQVRLSAQHAKRQLPSKLTILTMDSHGQLEATRQQTGQLEATRQQAGTCDEALWPNTLAVCGACEAVIDYDEHYDRQGTCSEYCVELGLVCESVWADDSNECSHHNMLSCSDRNNDNVCKCKVAQAAATCGDRCEECAVTAGQATCQKCKAGFYHIIDEVAGGACVQDCPIGFQTFGDSSTAGSHCKICMGVSRRRRSGPAEDGLELTCDQCPPGEVPHPDVDECQNIQLTCQPEQCGACAACMDSLTPSLAECLKTENPTETCYHPGHAEWCPAYHSKVNDCVAMSYGCFFKFRCESPCVCELWKDKNCGTLRGDPAATCQYKELSLIDANLSSRRDKVAASSLLDETLADKCDG